MSTVLSRRHSEHVQNMFWALSLFCFLQIHEYTVQDIKIWIQRTWEDKSKHEYLRHFKLNCYFQVKITFLLHNTYLILTQPMFHINRQTRQSTFSIDRIQFIWDKPGIILYSGLIADHNSNWLIVLFNVNADYLSTALKL